MTAIEQVLSVADAEVGYLEKTSNKDLDDKLKNAGKNNYTKYARDLDKLKFYNGPKNGFAWCAVFVDWCFVRAFGLETALKMTGQKLGGYGAGCAESVRYYKAIGRFYTDNPMPGDQIFFKSGKTITHTGLVLKVDSGRVHTVEGNTHGAAGVVSNGGGVCRKSYSLKYDMIAGYGRPNYSLVEEDRMTKDEVLSIIKEYEASKNTMAPGDWSKEHRDWAENSGLVQGDDHGNKRYKAPITREELVTVLHRFYMMVLKLARG